jgi:hypothetical protein
MVRRFFYYVLTGEGWSGHGGMRVVAVAGADAGDPSTSRTLLHLGAALVALVVASLAFIRLKVHCYVKDVAIIVSIHSVFIRFSQGPVGISAIVFIELVVNASFFVLVA